MIQSLMPNFTNYLLALIIGCAVSVMVVYNTLLGQQTSMALSFIINHLIGIIVITLILLILRLTNKRAKSRKAPWYLYFGGAFGFLILNANYITIINIGTSMSMATAVFGQSIASLMFDLTGFMGMQKYKFEKKKGYLLFTAFVGIIIMGSDGDIFTFGYLLIGVATGFITIIQMVYNSHLAQYKGNLFSARNNVLSGLIIALIIYSFNYKPIVSSVSNLSGLPFLIIFGGGLLAIGVVVGSNFLIPRIPTLYAGLLISASQIIASVVLDYYFFDYFSYSLLIGSLIVLFGTAASIVTDKRSEV